MGLNYWVRLFLLSSAKFALRAGLFAIFFPMSSAAETSVIAPDRAIASFQQDAKAASTISTTQQVNRSAKKAREMATAQTLNAQSSVIPNDLSSLVTSKPTVITKPTTTLPVVPVVAPAAPAPAAPAPSNSPDIGSMLSGITGGGQKGATQTPPAQGLDGNFDASHAGTQTYSSNRNTYQPNSDANIAPTQSAPPVQMTGVSPSDYNPKIAEGRAKCLDCENKALEKIPVPKSRPRMAGASTAPPSRGCPNCSCGQRELIAAAKRVAPMRSRSWGLCGPGVQKIIAAVERKFPGFDDPPMPASGRYPMPTVYNPIGMKGDIAKRGWTKLSPFTTPENAPPGTVAIFRGPAPSMSYRQGYSGAGTWVGHITIKGDDGLWYTDGRTPTPAGPNRYLEAAFIPGPSQNRACGDNVE